jgi:FtsZ-interacting cell division protein ZipA
VSVPSTVVAAIAAGDPAADRVVYGIVIALIVIGVLLLGITVWVFRQTRVDPELLAPLERMADRSWSSRDPATQRRMLDEVRPVDAVPLHREPGEPTVDEEFEQADRPVTSFDDLKDPESEERSDELGSEEQGSEEQASEEQESNIEESDEAESDAAESDAGDEEDHADDEADGADHVGDEADEADEADHADDEPDEADEAVSSGADDPPGDGGAGAK